MKLIRPHELLLPVRALNFPGLGISPRIRSEIYPGEQNYTAAGTYDFVAPAHNTMSVDIKAGSGGGSGGSIMLEFFGEFDGTAGAAGGLSRFQLAGVTDLLANGGGGGQAPVKYWNQGMERFDFYDGQPGANGTASGGDTNTTGGADAAGVRGYQYWPVNYRYGGNGGRGGRCIKTFGQGVIPSGSHITVIVGVAGAHGTTPQAPGITAVQPTSGSAGSVHISWG